MNRLVRCGISLLVPLALSGCDADGAGPEETTISKEAFISTYVALRAVSLLEPNQLPADSDRDRVLEEHGVTQEDLLLFAEVHGGDVDYIETVWNEIEERLEALREDPDSSESNT